MLWCGGVSVRHAWKSPCVVETCAGALMLFTALIVYAVQQARLNKLRKHVSDAARFTQGMITSETLRAGISAFVCSLHLGQLVATILTDASNFPNLLIHGACAVSWALVFILNKRGSEIHAVLDYRAVFATAVLVYSSLLYVYTLEYLEQHREVTVGLKLAIWTGFLEVSCAVLLTALEFDYHVKAPAPEGYIALADVEEGGDGKVKRTWLTLFIMACQYVWPSSTALKIRVLLCAFLILVMRGMNVAVPVVYKLMVNHFIDTVDHNEAGHPWTYFQIILPWVVLYLLLTFFQGGMGGGVVGLVNNLRSFLFIPVGQDTFFRINQNTFHKILDLDLEFHVKRKTGEVTKVIDRGTSAIQNILSTIVFSLGPQLLDVLICSTYLAMVVNPAIALVVFITIGSYMPLTVIVTEWRNSIRRAMNTAENARSARITDALLNYETIKYHNNEGYEIDEYTQCVKDYQKAEYNFTASLNLLNVVQSVVMFGGVCCGLLILCRELQQGQITVGDTVLFLSVMAQLYAPLNFFGTYYRIILQYFTDMENLFDLLDKQPKVVEKPGAKPLLLTLGEVEFENVTFGYDLGQPVVRNLSFKAPGGGTVAFVGATGSGKSTLTRLLFRFYDVQSGTIRIDGQAITDVSLSSLRTPIGLVPQDCVLFNDTIRHNIRYGRLAASDPEMIAAADAACIHTTISSKFPKGYDTLVGERGLRLSGGEKQRVAFARALLKNAPILILDEATSALDSITEKKVQTSLQEFRADRTLLVVAHRLSTIMDADLICVMKDGTIVERGKHEELLAANGLYYQMWNKQLQSEEEWTPDAGATPVQTSSNTD